MDKKTLGIAAGLLGLAVIVIIMGTLGALMSAIASSEKNHQQQIDKGVYMPKGATDIVRVGTHWQEFTYKGQRFLFYKKESLDKGHAAIVKIDMPKLEAKQR